MLSRFDGPNKAVNRTLKCAGVLRVRLHGCSVHNPVKAKNADTRYFNTTYQINQ